MLHTMTGKVCIVTGANSGIGYRSALHLAAVGADVSIICRNEDKGKEAVQKIAQKTQNQITLYIADLSDLAQVQSVAQKIIKDNDKIDVLLNNVGAYFPSLMMNQQGYEMNLALNHLSYFLLTHHLLPLINQAPQGRIVNVASRAHRVSQLDFNDLHFRQRNYKSFTVYGTSKLMNILFTRHLAQRLQDSHVTVNCLHPGVVRTGFGQDYNGIFSILTRIVAPFIMSPEKGAATSIYLATNLEINTTSGAYFSGCKITKPRKWAEDDESAQKLWDLSVDLCKDFM
jgi:NAD(P)-dependent dehydrogenase (short-subunit alcohol dehydrogenase family)